MDQRRYVRWLPLRAALLITAARILLTRVQTTTVLRVLARRSGSGSSAVDPLEALLAVRRLGPRLRAGCLAQSVALAALLRRHGEDPTVVLGCRLYGAQDWGAHAWVELEGQRLEPLVQPDHAELARLPAARGWEITSGMP